MDYKNIETSHLGIAWLSAYYKKFTLKIIQSK